MSRAEAIRALDLQPDEYTLAIRSNAFHYSYVIMDISKKELPTPFGMSSSTTLLFVEDLKGFCSNGLYSSTVSLDASPQALLDPVSQSLDITASDSYGERLRLESAASVGASLPDSLRQSLSDYLINPSYAQPAYEERPEAFTLLDPGKESEFLASRPMVSGMIGLEQNGKTFYHLNGEFPAIFHNLAKNPTAVRPLEWEVCFDQNSVISPYAYETQSEGTTLAFCGMRLYPIPKGEQESVFERDFFLEGIDLPAKRMVVEYSSFMQGNIYSGKLEWFLLEDTDRQELINELAQKLSFALWEESEVDPLAGAGIQHQWNDDQGNRLCLQNDPQNRAVRIILQSG